MRNPRVRKLTDRQITLYLACILVLLSAALLSKMAHADGEPSELAKETPRYEDGVMSGKNQRIDEEPGAHKAEGMIRQIDAIDAPDTTSDAPQDLAQTPDDEPDSEVPAPSLQAPFTVYWARGIAALRARQYGAAREQFMVALEMNPQDPILLYQLGVVEFNLGNVAEGRARLRQAHSTLLFGKGHTGNADRAELRIEGKYNFTPVKKDDWDLQFKERLIGPGEVAAPASPELPKPVATYSLDVNSVYTMELSRIEREGEPPSRSRHLISIPIGLLLVWMFAR